MPQPLFAGHRVRALRTRLTLGQAAMAAELGISISYLSQIESGDRPLTRAVLARLARCYPDDWAGVAPAEDDALLVRLIQACAEGGAAGDALDRPELQRALQQQPALARRLVALNDALNRSQEQLRALDDRMEAAGNRAALPWEEVRDWFHLQQNYIDAIDREAERIAAALDGPPMASLARRLAERFGVRIEAIDGAASTLRDYAPDHRVLRVNAAQPPETTLFALAHLLGRLEFGEIIAGIAGAGMAPGTARALLAAGLANYAAGALLMPYAAFRDAARACRHDVDTLRQRFGTSFEQTCHRLSTLQRSGAAGIPVFFCRVDMAGNITKRHSATRLQFARFGGACPLWIVHEAVAIPDRILVQLAETPDGVRYVSMAKGLVKPSGSYARAPRRYAVALGCEARYADDFVYADGLRIGGSATPIGTSCRICPRGDCEQRAFPPATGAIVIDPDRRGATPYALGEA